MKRSGVFLDALNKYIKLKCTDLFLTSYSEYVKDYAYDYCLAISDFLNEICIVRDDVFIEIFKQYNSIILKLKIKNKSKSDAYFEGLQDISKVIDEIYRDMDK